ncbi:hypothetical protein H257_15008 [Aphanomyces astaci]|uniref:Uncharacterized protein n=1 Tax=Aphanomyces astaci TaxID=112090 RepID=W4FQV0_APHAT|nr:hypothetical protein H257_15008 [Aphanomyces astaci]ETV69179.1 hypothetical protein H257_15008 [Aphanomyces astaci]|eukprot:XP_009841281.1 hypothetical protein H257_15008 [Aphanomyces astaci]
MASTFDGAVEVDANNARRPSRMHIASSREARFEFAAMVNQAPRKRKDVSSSKKSEVIQQLHHFLVNGKLVGGAFTRTAEMLDIERRSVAYIWDTFCTRGTLTFNKCAKVGPKPKYSPDDVRNLVRDVPMDQRSTTRDISAATGLSMGTLAAT